MKKNENDGAVAQTGISTLADVPGMGDVSFPTASSPGSGDVFGGVMGFGTWKKSKKRKRKKRRG